MASDWSLPLSCLIYGSDLIRTGDVADRVRAYSDISQIDEVARLSNFRDHLSRHAYDFVVVMLAHADDNLPACILRYPELKVLAITPARKIHSLDDWMAQGASDVVSAQRRGKCRHALQRIIEECRVKAELRLASEKLASQNRLQKLLLNSQEQAVLLWQNGTVLDSNCHLDELIGCHALDPQSRSIEWKRWISAPCYAQLHSPGEPVSGKLIISNHRGLQYEATVERITVESGDAQLIRLNTRAIDNTAWSEEALDATTGVLLPEAFLNAMDSWLQSTTKNRYTVAQISINEPDLQNDENAANSTVKELLSYRIAMRLQEEFKKGSLIGRTGSTTMTLLPFHTHKHSRELATRIRECLGTVGELLDDANCIQISTLTLAPNTLNASEVIHRLNRRQQFTDRQKPLASTTSRPTPEDLPVLSVRA